MVRIDSSDSENHRVLLAVEGVPVGQKTAAQALVGTGALTAADYAAAAALLEGNVAGTLRLKGPKS